MAVGDAWAIGTVLLCEWAVAGELHALPGMAPRRQRASHVLSCHPSHSPYDAVQMGMAARPHAANIISHR